MKTLSCLVALLPLLTGCAGTAKLVNAMGKDNAALSVNINTIYGTARLVRFMPLAGSEITANPDGSITVRNAVPQSAAASPVRRK